MERLSNLVVYSMVLISVSCGGSGGPAGKTDIGLDLSDVISHEVYQEISIEIEEEIPSDVQEILPADQLIEVGLDIQSEEQMINAPVIYSITPSSGPEKGGNLVAIKGDFFSQGARVFFSSAEADNVTVGGQTLLTCIVPKGTPGKVNVKVRNPDGLEGTLEDGYTYLSSEILTIISVSPSEGFVTGGNLVAIKGSGFTNETKVYFGDSPASDVNVGGSTLLTCKAPPGKPGKVSVTVENPDGAKATLENVYEYMPVEELTITAINPNKGPVEGGQIVMITGTGFVDGSVVYFGDTPVTSQILGGPHVLIVTTPAHVAGVVDVTIKIPNGDFVTLPSAYEFIEKGEQQLTIYSLFPTSGPTSGGTLVVIKGQGFKPGAKVFFGDAQAFSVTVEDQGIITCVTPKSKAGLVSVTVNLPDGKTATLKDAFEYVDAEKLTISSISPTKGPVTGGILAMITGTGFEPGIKVFFGSVEASNVSVAGLHLVIVTVPENKPGKVDIKVINPLQDEAVLPMAFTYEEDVQQTENPPTITSIWPKQGPTSGGTYLQITGKDFAEGVQVFVADVPCPEVIRQGATNIIAITPEGKVGSASVRVQNPDGKSATLASAFKYIENTLPAPQIETVWPNSAPTTGGTIVEITGLNFQSGAKVMFGMKFSDKCDFIDNNHIVTIAPPGEEGIVSIIVINPDGQVTNAKDVFSYFIPGTTGTQPPLLTKVDPTTSDISGGIDATLYGAGFDENARVYFGSVRADVISVVYGTMIKAVVPKGSPGLVDVTVVNPDGWFATLKSAFAYFEAPPLISNIEPDQGPEQGGTLVAITGKNFKEGAQVRFDGISAPCVVESSSLIHATTPPHIAGLVDVMVRNPSGQSDTLKNGFKYIAIKPKEPPSITSISPDHGPAGGGIIVVIGGKAFQQGCKVYFGDNISPMVNFFGPEVITVTVPKGVPGSKVDVMVKNPDGQSGVLEKGFLYELEVGETLEITSVNPSSGPATGGTFVSIIGSGFVKGTKVFFGSNEATSNFVSEGVLSAVTPPGSPGLVDVLVRRPDNMTAIAYNAFSYIAQETIPPIVNSVSPSVGPKSGGTTVKITGANFKQGAKVMFGPSSASQVVINSEQMLSCVTPPGEVGSVAVSVVNPDGGAGTLASAFTYYDPGTALSPLVFSVEPYQGQALGGDKVTIYGKNFKVGLSLYICQTPATVSTDITDNKFTATTPPGKVGVCDVTVVNPDGLSGTLTAGFKYIPATPVPTEVVPSAGLVTGGTSVVIKGSGFMDGAKVRFGTNDAVSVEYWSPTTLKAQTPPGQKGSVDVIVTNPGGVSGTLAGGFTYVEEGETPVPPKIEQITPSKGPLTGGTPVEIKGSNFKSGAMVIFGQTVVSESIVVSSSLITAKSPKASKSGPVDVTVLNPDGMGTTLKDGFIYEQPSQPAPVLIGVAPSSGPAQGGTLVTVTGAYLLSGASYYLGEKPLGSLAYINQSLVTGITPPADPGTVDLTYVGPDGQTVKLASAYTYVPAPTLDKVSPNVGPMVGGTEVTLYGTNFQTGIKAFFGQKEANVINHKSPLILVVSTPQASQPGAVDVSVKNPDGQVALLKQGFEYIAPPKIVSISPNSGPQTGGTICNIIGQGFYPQSQVLFGSKPATSINFISSQALIVTTPENQPGKVSVSVKNPDGTTAVLPDAFTFVSVQGMDPAPIITDITPTAGPDTGGTPVTLIGDNFNQGAVVKFGLKDGEDVVVVGPKLILVRSPAQGQGKVKVAVMNPDGQVAYAPNLFEYLSSQNQGPAPKILLVNPTSGPTKGGTIVTIAGANFMNNAMVLFGETPATDVDVVSQSEVKALSPSHAKGVVSITLVNPDGQSSTVNSAFTYLAPPTVVSVNPKSGPAAGGTKVTIQGTEFVYGENEAEQSKVLFCTSFAQNQDCKQADFTKTVVVDSTKIEVITPVHTAGITDVAIVNPDSQSGYLAKSFTFNPLPVITGIQPASGTTLGGTQVTISGSGFQEGASVAFGSSLANNVVVASANAIVCSTPSGNGKVDVSVTNPDGGKATLTNAFTYIPPPTISKIVPSVGPETGGISVTIEGSGFSTNPVSKVWFGNILIPEADTQVLSANAITVKIPAGKGAVTVKVVNPDGQMASLDGGFTYIPPTPPPTISYLVPTKGSTLGGYAVQIIGNNFMDGAKVYLGKPGAWKEGIQPLVKNAGTLIAFTAPASDKGLVDVRVVNTDGQEALKKDGFEYVPPQTEVPLKVFSIEPNRAVVSGGSTVTIAGQGFKAGVQVSFGKAPDWATSTSVAYIGSNLLLVVVPPAPKGQDGKVDVRVANPPTQGGQEVFILTDGFTYTKGAVFVQASGHRLPPEPHGKGLALIVDVNGDGLNDVVVSRENNDYILINTPTQDGKKGWFRLTWAFTPNHSWGEAATWMVHGDFDEDGDQDLVIRKVASTWSSSNRMIFCANNGAGQFSCSKIGDWNCGEQKFVVGDLNCDGHLDIFVPRYSTDTNCPNYILLGNGKGGFEFRSDVLPAQYENSRGAALADVDLDGDVDILIANDTAMQKRLYYNNCNNIPVPPACAMNIPGCTMFDYEGHRYAYCTDSRSWQSAEDRCALYGFHLATIDSSQEQTFLRSKISSYAWIGFTDQQVEGQWIWPYGTSNYKLWCSGEPNNSGGNENCASMTTSTNGCWIDANCGTSYHYICESQADQCPSPWKFTDAQYGAGKNFPISGGNTYDVALVDLDGNGYPDAIVANWGQQTAVYMNYGGNFQLDDGFHWPQNESNPYISKLYPVDIDLDGDKDIVAIVQNGIRIYKNDLSQNGPGLLSDKTSESLPSLSQRGDFTWASIGDIDQDLLPDIFYVANYHSDRLLMNNGFEEGKPWTDNNRVGYGKFRFNTYMEVPEIIRDGVAAAIGDLNNDGFLDIISGGSVDRLYVFMNEQGRWVNESETRIPNNKFHLGLHAITLSDLNKDGDLDLIVINYNDYNCNDGVCNGQLYQFVNDGKGFFTDVTSANCPSTDGRWVVARSADFDMDGDMDVFIANDYSNLSPGFFVNGGDVFNNGGAYLLNKTSFYTQTGTSDRVRVAWFTDINYDMRPDLILGRNGQNHIYLNDPNKGFISATNQYLPAIDDDTRSLIVMDFDGDNDEDIFVANWGQDRFHIRESVAKFSDVTTSALPVLSLQTQGVAAGDLDLDGLPDIITANYEQKKTMYGNLGGDFFTNLSNNLPEDWDASRHVFLLDVDGDGDKDLYIVNNGQDRLYINTFK